MLCAFCRRVCSTSRDKGTIVRSESSENCRHLLPREVMCSGCGQIAALHCRRRMRRGKAYSQTANRTTHHSTSYIHHSHVILPDEQKTTMNSPSLVRQGGITYRHFVIESVSRRPSKGVTGTHQQSNKGPLGGAGSRVPRIRDCHCQRTRTRSFECIMVQQ